jgi:TonB family protein
MKREKHPSSLTRISLILLITLKVTLILLLVACGKTVTSGTEGGEATAAQPVSSTTDSDIPFVQVAEMPLFPGGDIALLKYIGENTVYPEEAKKNSISGKVIVRFIVEKDCTVSDATILKSVDPLLDAEAVRVISSLPKFEKPAINDGVAVRVFYMVPITFELK